MALSKAALSATGALSQLSHISGVAPTSGFFDSLRRRKAPLGPRAGALRLDAVAATPNTPLKPAFDVAEAYEAVCGEQSASLKSYASVFGYRRMSVLQGMAIVMASVGFVVIARLLRQGRVAFGALGFLAQCVGVGIVTYALQTELFRRPRRFRSEQVALPDSRTVPLRVLGGGGVHCLVTEVPQTARDGGNDDHDTGPRNRVLHMSHGFGACSLSFAPLMRSLKRRAAASMAGSRMISQDATGFGLSPRPALGRWRQYTSYAQIKQTQEVLDHLGGPAEAQELVLFGHSMGSFTAAGVAALAAPSMDPSRPIKLVLISPALFYRGAAAEGRRKKQGFLGAFRRLGNAIATALSKAAFVVCSPALYFALWRVVASEKFWKRGLALAFAKPAVDQGALLRYRWPSLVRRWDTGMVLMLYARIYGQKSVAELMDDAVGQLASLARDGRVEVLLVHGSNDTVVPPANSQRLRDAIPGATLLELRGAGHCAHEENSERFAEIVERFVASSEAVEGGVVEDWRA